MNVNEEIQRYKKLEEERNLLFYAKDCFEALEAYLEGFEKNELVQAVLGEGVMGEVTAFHDKIAYRLEESLKAEDELAYALFAELHHAKLGDKFTHKDHCGNDVTLDIESINIEDEEPRGGTLFFSIWGPRYNKTTGRLGKRAGVIYIDIRSKEE